MPTLRISNVYEEYAKEHDLTYISMFVLQTIIFHSRIRLGYAIWLTF